MKEPEDCSREHPNAPSKTLSMGIVGRPWIMAFVAGGGRFADGPAAAASCVTMLSKAVRSFVFDRRQHACS